MIRSRHASVNEGTVRKDPGEHVLVLRRRNRLGPSGQAEIRLPKGHIEQGESRRRAALREVAEEAGLLDVEVLADLGHQVVVFNWDGYHYIRDESYFLMKVVPRARFQEPEYQFERLWLTWDDALAQLTFGAEREWIRRAREIWGRE